jgi:hypothetical protein
MQLFVKVIPLRAGTSEPAGEPRLLRCPLGVAPDTILPFLTEMLGEAIATAWTSIGEHACLDVGWVFFGAPAIGRHDAVDFACVPFIEAPGGSLRPLFEVRAGQRRQFAQLADSRSLDIAVIQQARRADRSVGGPGGQDTGAPDAPLAGPLVDLDQALDAIARETAATLRIYPRPGCAARRIVLRNDRDDRGTRYEDAALEHDGTLRIAGHDQGPRVSEFWGNAITSYEWVYVVARDRIPALLGLLGGRDGDDVLAVLAAYHQHAGEQISDILNHPDVTAHFSNWHS